MIEFSLGKMALLALIALIVLGPEKLPGAARTAGALLRRVRSGWDNVRAEVERELEIDQIKRTAREAATQAESARDAVKAGLHGVHEPLSAAVAEATAALQPDGAVMAEIQRPERDSNATADLASEVAGSNAQQAELPLGEPLAKPKPPAPKPPAPKPSAPKPPGKPAHDDA